ncbi:mannitol dehydrogenase family protein [Yoonia sp. SS1-5]|uniref:Mannitol dehydrogenase family protein n=1 Tax=Yoonia rhodophyticola TaxID=3137370 RepID=A0AAN0M9D3_9RHOB
MPRILHFGIGNFHRAHQAAYIQVADPAWRITGVSLRHATIRDALASQGFGYTLVIRDADAARYERMAVHDEVLVGPEDGAAILDRIADPDVKMITLTVTEKGYHLGADGRLNKTAPLIAHDLAAQLPSTAIGFLARGLRRRADECGPPVNIVSCDNLPDNGRKLAQAIVAFSEWAGLDLASYLDAHVRFPNTMVDRIVPATTDALRAEVADATGLMDAHPVATEAFSEWYIADTMLSPIPDLGGVGVRIVADVAPFELRKLRMLNGAHSLLAYAGVLAGHDYVHQAIRDAQLRDQVAAFWEEAASTLPAASRDGADDYAQALLARFANPGLRHELRQIAMDGSLKLPIRIAPVIAARQARGQTAPAAEGARHAWASFVAAALRSGTAIDDPRADIFAELGKTHRGDEPALISALLDQISG